MKVILALLSLIVCTSVLGGEMKDLIFVIKIKDVKKYSEYREKIKPLFKKYGVVIVHEYEISKVLHSGREEDGVNRLAHFSFPNPDAKASFFNDKVYKSAKPLLLESTTNLEKVIE